MEKLQIGETLFKIYDEAMTNLWKALQEKEG